MARVVPFPQARDLLARVKQQGLRIALATSSEKEDVGTYSRIVGMEDLLDQAATSADAQSSKPDRTSSRRR